MAVTKMPKQTVKKAPAKSILVKDLPVWAASDVKGGSTKPSSPDG